MDDNQPQDRFEAMQKAVQEAVNYYGSDWRPYQATPPTAAVLALNPTALELSALLFLSDQAVVRLANICKARGETVDSRNKTIQDLEAKLENYSISVQATADLTAELAARDAELAAMTDRVAKLVDQVELLTPKRKARPSKAEGVPGGC